MRYEFNDANYNDLIGNIRSYFSKEQTILWERRNIIKIISYNNEDMTVKSFKIPHVLNKIMYTFFRHSKAKRSYENSMKILDFVPKPVGYSEYTKFGLLHDSYYVCEKYAYDYTIREPLLDKNFEDRENIFKQFAEFTYALQMNGVVHLDYSPGNILIKKISDDTYEFKIIDVNRMKFKVLTLEEKLKYFSKLWARDEDLKSIMSAYVKMTDMNEEEGVAMALTASQKHKDKKNFKKRLKGKKVVD